MQSHDNRSVNPPCMSDEEIEADRLRFAEIILGNIQKALARQGLTLKIEAATPGATLLDNPLGNA